MSKARTAWKACGQSVPALQRKPGALRDGAPFKCWDLPEALRKVRRRLDGRCAYDRQMADILMTLRTEGVDAVEAACAGALSHAARPSPRPDRRTPRPPRTRDNAPGCPRANTAPQRRHARHSMDPASPPARPSNPAKTPPIPDGETPFLYLHCHEALFCSRPGRAAPAVRGSSETAPGSSHAEPRRPRLQPSDAKPERRPNARSYPFPHKMGCIRQDRALERFSFSWNRTTYGFPFLSG